ncbi:MAG TPA: hypothetical protein VF485_16910 [Sphingomonas sp.]
MKLAMILLGAVATLTAMPAYAASASGDERAVMQSTARCLVAQAPADMRRWVLADGPMLMYQEVKAVSARTGCSAAGVGFEYWAFRGALAEALLFRDLQPGEEPDWAAVKAPTDIEIASNWKNPKGRSSYMTNVVAECVAQSDVKGSLALLKTAPGSSDEAAALAGLRQDITACRERSRGFADKIPDDAFRARLGLAAYELNDAVHGAASGTGK